VSQDYGMVQKNEYPVLFVG